MLSACSNKNETKAETKEETKQETAAESKQETQSDETKAEAAQAEGEAEKLAPATVQLFIANSLNDVMLEIADLYNETQPDVTIVPYALGSQELREQIENGVECDIFISASMGHMTTLDENKEKDYVKDGSIVKLLTNELVLITGKNSGTKVTSFETIPDCEQACLPLPERMSRWAIIPDRHLMPLGLRIKSWRWTLTRRQKLGMSAARLLKDLQKSARFTNPMPTVPSTNWIS